MVVFFFTVVFLEDSKTYDKNEIVQKNSTAVAFCKELRLYLENNGLPMHRYMYIWFTFYQ